VLRFSLLMEEYTGNKEFEQALMYFARGTYRRDNREKHIQKLEQAIDGAADFIYIAAGMAIEFGSCEFAHVSTSERVLSLTTLLGDMDISKNKYNAIYKMLIPALTDNEAEIDLLAMSYFETAVSNISRLCVTRSDVQEGFRRVHHANMSKATNGVILRREDGKILKPDGWREPNHRDLAEKAYERLLPNLKN